MAELDSPDEGRVLLFTPTGRDAALLAETFSAFGIQSQRCGSLAETITHIDAGCATLVIAEECLTAVAVKELGRVLDAQPTWSDLPVIILTTAGEQTPVTDYKLKMLTPLGNISLIERPVRPQTLVSIVQSALRARERQYQFRAQAKALQRSNQDLERFANAASHDLQEPLRMIGSYSQLLAKRNEGKLDEDSRLFIRYVLNGVDRMRTLIRDLLEFSRYTGGEYPPPVPVDCNAVLGLALEYLRFKITETGASIKFERLPLVLGHQSRFLQVFQNLIANALKYCEYRPEVAISAERRGDFWTIAIQDNGIGIAPEHQDRIFGLFQRLHSREEYPGSGIGLATCKRIIEQYGGRLWVESAPGAGSTFYFTARDASSPRSESS